MAKALDPHAARKAREQRGVYEKYRVERTDGKPIVWCFVLEITDPLARIALSVYAAQCLREGEGQLAQDLYDILYAYEEKHPDA